MSRLRLVSLLLIAALVAAVGSAPAGASPASGDATATASSVAKKKKKRCKKGTKAVKVRSKGKTRTVCRKKSKRKAGTKTPAPVAAPQGPAGPSVAEVESIIRGQAQANHETWLGPESIEVVFERPTQVMSMVMYDPYEGDPLHAGGPIEAWPVRAWVKVVNHRDTTPEDDTNYAGCLGHLNSWWPYDTLHMFYRDLTGAWAYRTSSAKPGDCG